ncbi:MAG: hypothetical protein ABEJ43_06590 [Haloferacaceae archaeon]
MPPHHDPHNEPGHEHPHDEPPDSPGPPDEEPHTQEPPHPEDSTEHSRDADGFLFVISYEDDAERKRAEYLFNNWEDGNLYKPEGIVRVAEDVDHEELYEGLLVKFRPEQIDAYSLSSLDAPRTPEQRSIERSIAADPDTVRSMLQYLISRKKGTETGDGAYEVYTNKGRADVEVSLSTEDDETSVFVQVQGHPPVIDQLTTYLEEELDEFEASR